MRGLGGNVLRGLTHAARRSGPISRQWAARMTAPIRLLPDFIIIGAQRSGTTSLYRYLSGHPHVRPATRKEVHFFDVNFHRGTKWYQSNFPSIVHKAYVRRLYGRDIVTGEASPYYIFHPHAARRAQRVVPRVKLIVLLRNPVDRAYSHYHLCVHRGIEPLPFEEAIDREQERLHGELGKMLEDEFYYSFRHQNYSYLSRGIYVDQLRAWLESFPRDQFLILRSEDLFQEPGITYERALRFLGLRSYPLAGYEQHNPYSSNEMPRPLRERLVDYFAPHNQHLSEFLGIDFGWDH